METAGENYYITCAVPDFENVKKALAKKYKLVTSEIAMIPKDTVKIDEETGRKIMNLMENLDDSEDVQKIYHNFILPESLLGK
jgi:transcriptional/translational regulatory protein YebC/TACO1